MKEVKPNVSQEVFLEAQMKAIAAVVGGLVLLEEAVKNNLAARQLYMLGEKVSVKLHFT